MSTPLTRRSFTAGSLATILGGALVASPSIRLVSAQGATDLTSLGLPTLDVTVTASAFEGVPEELAAGRYLLNVSVPDDMEFGGASLMSPPSGMTAQDFLSAVGIGGPPPGAPTDASPEMAEASPAAEGGGEEEELQLLPLFVYQATFAGGTAGAGGSTTQVIIDLPPGEWIVWGDDPFAPQPPVIFMVTGDMPADLVEPEADITTTYIDFAIDVQGSLTAGDHLMLVQNHGAQPHFLVLLKGPESLTREHSWFAAYGPYPTESEATIASVVMFENVGEGITYATPATKAIYEAYLRMDSLHELMPPAAQPTATP